MACITTCVQESSGIIVIVILPMAVLTGSTYHVRAGPNPNPNPNPNQEYGDRPESTEDSAALADGAALAVFLVSFRYPYP